MTPRPSDVLNIGVTVALAALASLATWYFTRPPSKLAIVAATSPAKVSRSLKEADLIVVTLTADAEQRLGLRVEPLARRAMPRVRTYGGEIIVPSGQTVVVSAPLSGTLALDSEREHAVRAGQPVTRGEPVFRLTPLLTPDARANVAASFVDAEGQAKSAQTQLVATAVSLQRAKQLFAGEAGSKRALDDAQAQHDLARQALEAAEARRTILGKVASDADTGSVNPLRIASPVDGVLRNVLAFPGEAVPAGAVLFEVLNLATVWVRVPVYVGELNEVDRDAAALIGPIAPHPDNPPRPAPPVAAPPSANPLAATLDLFYQLDNQPNRLAPGQRIGATLPLRGEQESLVAPWSAVIHDIHGGTWVYEQTAPQQYSRRRVLVRHVVGETAVLADGPPPGTLVVTAGAAELFGTEVGFAK